MVATIMVTITTMEVITITELLTVARHTMPVVRRPSWTRCTAAGAAHTTTYDPAATVVCLLDCSCCFSGFVNLWSLVHGLGPKWYRHRPKHHPDWDRFVRTRCNKREPKRASC
jgi:hypothetical protein